MVTATGATAEEVLSSTELYLEQVETCTSHLPDAVDAYGTDPDAFVAAVDRLSAVESECDATLRELRTLVGEALPPNFTEVFLRVEDVSTLYARIDVVPNRAEQFARELGAMDPGLSRETRDSLRGMATLVAEATTVLTDATGAYVEGLVTAGEPVRVRDAVESVAALEGECDGHKYVALRRAFGTLPTAEALVVRQLLLSIDAAMDAAEDAADHLLSMAGADW